MIVSHGVRELMGNRTEILSVSPLPWQRPMTRKKLLRRLFCSFVLVSEKNVVSLNQILVGHDRYMEIFAINRGPKSTSFRLNAYFLCHRLPQMMTVQPI